RRRRLPDRHDPVARRAGSRRPRGSCRRHAGRLTPGRVPPRVAPYTDLVTRMPTLYAPHGGGPWPWMELPPYGPPGPHAALAEWLQSYAASLPETPRVIVCPSAHWETPDVTVSTAAQPSMIYDYGGFPPHTY